MSLDAANPFASVAYATRTGILIVAQPKNSGFPIVAIQKAVDLIDRMSIIRFLRRIFLDWGFGTVNSCSQLANRRAIDDEVNLDCIMRDMGSHDPA